MIKCYFACTNADVPLQPMMLPIMPRIGEMLFFEREKPCYKIIDIQYQFKRCGEFFEDAEFILVNIVLKKMKGR